MIRLRDLAATALLTGATGLVLWWLWWWAGYPVGSFVRGLAGHGPDPFAWPRLVALWLPLAHGTFAIGYLLLARWHPAAPMRRHFRANQLAVALVAGLAGALLILGGSGPWRIVVSGGYLLVVGVKTAVFLHGLWHWLAARPGPPYAMAAGVFLGTFIPYLLLDGYVATAISTSGDEPYYLLLAHSLVRDGDTDLANNLAHGDYLPFYWGTLDTPPITSGPVYSIHMGLQPLLLVPGYWLAGRVGAMVTMSLFGAAALALAFLLALRLGASLRAAFLAWLGAAFSVPVLSFVGSPWPEMSAALFLTLGVYALSGDRATAPGYATVGVCLGALFTRKVRFVLLVVPLMLGLVRRVTWKTLLALAAAGIGLLLAAIGYDAIVTGGLLLARPRTGSLLATAGWLGTMTVQPILRYRGLLGLLLDQGHGVLLSAPVFFLALGGMVVALAERRWRLLLLVGGPFAATWYYVGGVATGGLPQWPDGFSPPARYLVAALPPLVALVALAVDRIRAGVAWTITVGLFALTFGQTVILTVWPGLRFQSNLGRSAALVDFWRYSGLDPGRLLPSYVAPDATWVGPGLAVLALSLALGYLLTTQRGGAPTSRDVVAGVAGAALVVGVLLGYVWWRPWGVFPAAVWEGPGGTGFRGIIPVDTGDGLARQERLVWAAQRDAVIEVAPRLPAGRYRLTVRAGAQAEGPGPAMALRAASEPARDITLEAATPTGWRERDYAYEVRWRGGRLPVRIDLTQISGRDPVRRVYLRHLQIVRAGP